MRRGDVGIDMLAQVIESPPNRLELDPGIEQALDHPQLEQVAIRVGAAAAAARRVGE